MERVLVSACLMGERVRHDGSDRLLRHPALDLWREEGRVVPFCPEAAVGLPVPRPPAEIVGGADGARVVSGEVRIVDIEGRDVTAAYLEGARAALARSRSMECRFALLKDDSPSCGRSRVHDGDFRGRTVPGRGVAAAVLETAGVRVFPPDRIDELVRSLAERERAVEDADDLV